MTDFRPFRLGDLFDIHPTKAYKLLNDELFDKDGVNRVVSNSNSNNGVTGWTNLPCTETGGIITFSDTSTSNAIFYQPFPFVGYPHVQGMYPIEHKEDWVEGPLLYLVTLMRCFTDGRFGYTTKFSRKVASEMDVLLPVDETGEIDFDYMTDYINRLKVGFVDELESSRGKVLREYLDVAALDSCDLSAADMGALLSSPFGVADELGVLPESLPPRKNVSFFRMGDLFDKVTSPYRGSGRKQDNVSMERSDQYDVPLVNCKYGDNGIMYYGSSEDFVSHDNVLSIIYNGPPTEGQTYFQDTAGIYSDSYLIALRGDITLSRESGLYLAAAINASIHNEESRKYSRGNKATWTNKVENDFVCLPVDDDGKPDFDYMKAYVRAEEKLVIAEKMHSLDETVGKMRRLISDDG